MTSYHTQRKASKARKWLERLSLRIHFYSTILDVFAQHHPEYVALVWGSVKFLIIVCIDRTNRDWARLIHLKAVVNQEKVVATLAKAMSQIADMLPRVELQSILYPTDRIKAAVADLYASILRFLIRARDWYEEGKLHHFIHSITRPIELRYNDILEQISHSSRVIDQLVVSAQQAEFRDMHNKIKETSAKVEKISNAMTCKSAG